MTSFTADLGPSEHNAVTAARWQLNRILPAALLATGDIDAEWQLLEITNHGGSSPRRVGIRVNRPGQSANSAGPDLTTAWETSAMAIRIEAGGQNWQLPGPAHADALVPDTIEPYFWQYRDGTEGRSVIDSIISYFAANPGAAATVTLSDDPPPMPRLIPVVGLSVQEALPVNTVVGMAAMAVEFPDGVAAWRFGNGTNTSFLFNIDPLTGVLSTNAVIDLGAMPQTEYTRTIVLEQGGETAQVDVQIRITHAPVPLPTEPTAMAAWFVRFPDFTPPINVWTGEGPITIQGVDYVGMGQLVSVGRLNSELSQPVHEMTLAVSLQVLTAEQRALFLADPGPRRVEIGQAFSADGVTWGLIPRTFRGRLSAPRLTDDVYQINVVTRVADIDRGRPQFWSHESQVVRYPGDLGFQHMRRIAEGLDTTWPP